MRRLALLALLSTSGCFRFQERVNACVDAGRCIERMDGGVPMRRDAGPFVPLDGGGFCVPNAWCWESPLPHGIALNAIYVSPLGTVVVAGEEGMLAERSSTGWSSRQLTPGVAQETRFLSMYGQGEEVWVVGTGQDIQHRTGPSTWESDPSQTTITGVTGLDGAVVFGRFDGIVESPLGNRLLQLDAGDLRLATHRGELFALGLSGNEAMVVMSDGGHVLDVDGGTSFFGVAGIFGNDQGLWLAGGAAYRLNDMGRFQRFGTELQCVAPGLSVSLAATRGPPGRPGALGRVMGQAFMAERPAFDIISMFGDGSDAWAVGAAGQVYRRSGSTWAPQTHVPTATAIRALVEVGDDLMAYSESGDVLRRDGVRWKHETSFEPLRFADAIAEGAGAAVLTESYLLLSLDAGVSQAGQVSVSSRERNGSGDPALAQRVWRTPGGTTFVTGNLGVYVRAPNDDQYRELTSTPTLGIAGRGELVQVCSSTGVLEIDATTLNVTNASVPPNSTCHVVAAVGDGWVYGGVRISQPSVWRRDGAGFLQVTFEGDGSVESLAELPSGIAVGFNGFAILRKNFVSAAADVQRTAEGLNTVFFTLLPWRGHLVGGGNDGAILQRGPATLNPR